MAKYVLKRLGLAIITAFIVLSLTFILVKLLPVELPVGDAATKTAYCETETGLGYMISYKEEHPELGDYVFKSLPRDGVSTYYYTTPVGKQYISWLKNIFTKFDWGVSREISPNVKASVIIGERIVYSIRLNILSVIFSVPLGILLGIWAALKKNTMTDHTISTMVMIFISIPSFILILHYIYLLLTVLSVGIFPTHTILSQKTRFV
mgnify:CR=1 FL=1